MIQINELPIDTRFFAIKKFSMEFKDGSFQFKGVLRSKTRFLITEYKAICNGKFRQVVRDDFADASDEDFVESSYFDSGMIIGLDKDKVIRAWTENTRYTIDAIEKFINEERDLHKWLLESTHIKESMDKAPEAWI